MHVLLTGAAGHTGRHLLAALAQAGHTITAVRRTDTSDPIDRVTDGTEWIAQDLSLGTAALPDDYDAVIHAAAHAPPRADSPAAHVAHNIIATRNLLEHAVRRPRRRVIFLSTLSVYGRINASEVDESTPIRNPGSYGLSKLMGEHLLSEHGTRLASIALRLPGVVGTAAPGPWLARVLADIKARRTVRLHSPDHPFNNLVHIDDLTTFVVQLLDVLRPGCDVVTLAARAPVPLHTVIEAMAAAASVPVQPIVLPAPQPPFTISSERAIAQYGYSPLSVLAAVDRLAGTALSTEPALLHSSQHS